MSKKADYQLYKLACDEISLLTKSKDGLRGLESQVSESMQETNAGNGSVLPTNFLLSSSTEANIKRDIVHNITGVHGSVDALILSLERLRDSNYTATNYTRYNAGKVMSKCTIL